MLEVIEKLIILQDRDRQIAQLEAELAALRPKRDGLLTAADSARQAAEAARQQTLHLEAERKKLELEVIARQEQISRYSLQQFQTKKNEEYRALSHEIDNCKAAIARLEDQQLEIMEKSESAHRATAAASKVFDEKKREANEQVVVLDGREANLRKRFEELSGGRQQLAAAVQGEMLDRYERLRRTKGDRVVVSVEHSACGGCHMKLPAQVVLTCRAAQEVAQCPNCNRILYFIAGMDLAVAE